MPRDSATATTGKKKTDPPPYFLHPKLPTLLTPPADQAQNFQRLYNLMSASGARFLQGLQNTLKPRWSRKSLRLAYNLDVMKSKSPLEAIELPIKKTLGIGPVRMVYYRELVYGHYYQSMMEDTYLAGTSFFVVGGKRRDPEEWLAMDRFLAKTLMSLGLSWWKVEKVMAECVQNSGLPEAFLERYGADPTTTDFIPAWEKEWNNRKAFQGYKGFSRKFGRDSRRFQEQGRTVNDVEDILQGKAIDLTTEGMLLFDADENVILLVDKDGKLIIPSPPEDRLLNEILIPSLSRGAANEPGDTGRMRSGELLRDYGLHKILLNSRDLTQNSNEEFADYTTSQRSPLINSIIYGLGRFLWASTPIKHLVTAPTSRAVRRLMERRKAWSEMSDGPDPHYYMPSEFYMLIADILHHCPVVAGLPDDHMIEGSIGSPEDYKPLPLDPKDWSPIKPPQPMWEGLTADQVRQRYGEQAKKHRSNYSPFRYERP